MQSKIYSYFQRGGSASSAAGGADPWSGAAAAPTPAPSVGPSVTPAPGPSTGPASVSSGCQNPTTATAPAVGGRDPPLAQRFLSPSASPLWLLDVPRDTDVDELTAVLGSQGARPGPQAGSGRSGASVSSTAGQGWADVPDPGPGAYRGGQGLQRDPIRHMSAHRRAVARHWSAVRMALDGPIASSQDLIRCILRCTESAHTLEGDMGGRRQRSYRAPPLHGLEKMLATWLTGEELVALFGSGTLPAVDAASADGGASAPWWAPMVARGGGDGGGGGVTLPAGGGLLGALSRLARCLPAAGMYDSVPLLVQNQACEARLTQWQCAVVLANALFCAWPRRRGKRMQRSDANSPRLPDINFVGLYRGHAGPRPQTVEKMRCLFGYFARVVTALGPANQGTVVALERLVLDPSTPTDWHAASQPLGPLAAFAQGTIETERGATHADFANRWLGGGVLRHGCVQEEIRFVVAPECLLSLCLCEVMDDGEAVVITGPERYSHFTGYASSFQYTGQFIDDAATFHVARGGAASAPVRDIEVSAMDALKFNGRSAADQYKESAMRRECAKALAAMAPASLRASAVERAGVRAGAHPFASGNWGCGVFGGHHEVKSLLQWVAGRPLHLYTFGMEDLAKQLGAVATAVAREAAAGRTVTAGALWCALLVAGGRVRLDAPSPGDNLAGTVERAVASVDAARAALAAMEGRPLSQHAVILFAGAYIIAHARA